MHLPRHAEIWLPGYVRSMGTARRERRQRRGVTDILLCVADHFEPLNGDASVAVGARRVEAWLTEYPRMAGRFRDADGRPPQHTFFFPVEQYAPNYLEALARLTALGFGEVEIHLHHDGDTPEKMTAEILAFMETLHARHGLLPRDSRGALRYAFVHGNWALDNALPDGRWCGIDNEIDVLLATGCYADMTFPAAPSPAQSRTVNSIYYATGVPGRSRSHDRGTRARVGAPAPPASLLMIQGPLAVSFRRARWLVVPGLENASLHRGFPGTPARIADWLDCAVSVSGRPEWIFVKLHTHGGPERNASMLLGPENEAFHRHLLSNYNDGARFRLHYVTAREMANIVHAAEDGLEGDAGQYRDYVLPPPPCRA